jgi:hypothetical protein
MKRLISIILFAVLVFSNLSIVSADVTLSDQASTLNKLTLIQGNGVDFNLNGTLKRSEAVTFIVRILGKENLVKSNIDQYSKTSFSDVKSSDWFAAYVGYCATQNIVSGFPDGKYHPDDLISEKAFIKLVLSAMGYVYGDDFDWGTIYPFALSKGLVTDQKYDLQTTDNMKYVRSDVVSVLYNALTKPSKITNKTIIDTLVSENMIDRKTAIDLGLAKDTLVTAITASGPASTTNVNVIFNEGIQSVDINSIHIYETANKANTLTATYDKLNDQVLSINTSVQKADQPYTIEIANVVDKEGNTYPNLTSTFIGFTEMKVVSATATSDSKMVVNFSRAINPVDAAKIQIYEKDTPANKLTVAIDSQTDKAIVLTTSTQKPDQNYTVAITGVVDSSGTVTPINSNVIGYKLPEITSDLFKISKVVSVSKNVVNVYFTQPVNANAALPFYYEILKDNTSLVKGAFANMATKTLSVQNNVVSIDLKDTTISATGIYTLKVSGDLVSLYGVKLNDGAGESAIFANNTAENADLNVNNIYLVDARTLRIEFSKEIDPTSVQQLSNYTVTASNGVLRGVIKATIPSDGAGKAILVQVNSNFDKSTEYLLTMKNITDSFGLIVMSETKLPISGQNIPDHKDLQIVNVYAKDKLTLEVYFDRGLEEFAAKNTNNYTIISDNSFSTTPTSIYFDPKLPYKAVLYLPVGKEMTSSNNYKVRVSSSMKDELGNPDTANVESPFNGSSELAKPFVVEAKIIGQDTIKVVVQKELSSSGNNALVNNYTLEAKDGSNTTISKSPSSISFLNGTIMILRFDKLDKSLSYTLKFNTLTDYAGNVRSASDGLTSASVQNGG